MTSCEQLGFQTYGYSYNSNGTTNMTYCVRTETVVSPNTSPDHLQGVDSLFFQLGIVVAFSLAIALIVGLIATIVRAWTAPTVEDVREEMEDTVVANGALIMELYKQIDELKGSKKKKKG